MPRHTDCTTIAARLADATACVVGEAIWVAASAGHSRFHDEAVRGTPQMASTLHKLLCRVNNALAEPEQRAAIACLHNHVIPLERSDRRVLRVAGCIDVAAAIRRYLRTKQRGLTWREE